MKCDEIFAALAMLEKERGIPQNFMMGKIIQALTTAYKRDHEGVENVIVDVDEDKHDLRMYVQKEIVEEVMDPANEISLEDAKKRQRQKRAGRRGEYSCGKCGIRPHRRRQRQAGHHSGSA